MTVVYSEFVAAFPEFGNVTTFPEAQFDFWNGQSVNQLNLCRFGTSADLATMLFIAHNIVLSARAMQAAGSGNGVAGDVSGPVTSKSVGGVSKSMDVGAITTTGAGIFNSTSYGLRLLQMLRSFGTGPVYLPGPPTNVGQVPFGYLPPFGLTN